ncbi:MAG: flagellar basal-body rod protein FlgF [Mariprofundales bacterium]|nr:flagellar basal-body rod protein FlgF [Mariprofundales bacterium]
MNQGFFIAGSGADLSQRMKMDVITNNLANVNTTGFKADNTSFRTVMSSALRDDGAAYLGAGKEYTDMSEGPVRQTNNPLDLAISGPGFFSVRQADGSAAYTRAGNFQLNASGNIVTQSGLALTDSGGSPITLPVTGEITISRDGTISSNGQVVTKIGVAEAIDPRQVRKKGGSLFVTKPSNMQAASKSEVREGMLEQSNVNAVVSMVQMVEVTRSFQNLMKITDIYNQQQSELTNKVGRVG